MPESRQPVVAPARPRDPERPGPPGRRTRRLGRRGWRPALVAVAVASVAAAAVVAAWTAGGPGRGGHAGEAGAAKHARPDARTGAQADARARERAGTRNVPVVNGRRQPARVGVPRQAGGRYGVVAGTAPPPRGSRGELVRYAVEVERGLPFQPEEFAAVVHRVLNDPRGWGHGGTLRFQRVSRGPVSFRVSLSSPALTDRMCLPLHTHGRLSCHSGGRAVLNARRWDEGAPSYRGDLAAYREYLVNHEVGHALGHGHERCPGRGLEAPVMVQQTKSLYGCRANPWPHPRD
ncbi:DUF3152 domain-containing protein [Actinomadura viridis]|uniref:DUF3152 domain-containing protein n=1 Tax=Actinomadura viridis TaxID=58110 RepID=UPI0036BBFBF8